MDTSNYGFWPKAQLWRQRFKKDYKFVFWGGVLLAAVLVSAGIQLNQNGHRMWNLGIGLGLGLVMLYHLFKPTLLETIGVAGFGQNLTDGKKESLAKEIGGAFGLIGQYARLAGYVFIVIQTVFMFLAIHRFEDASQAYIAVLAAMIFALIFWVARIKGRWFIFFLLVFWGTLMAVTMTLAYFVPNYFKDEASYLVRHEQGRQEAARREAAKAPLLAKLERGETLTLAERRQLQYLEDQEEAVGSLIRSPAETTLKVATGLPEQAIVLPITPGRYTCRAELTARNPADLAVSVNGVGVDLATTAYINGKACNGRQEVSFGPDGQAALHWNLDADARAQVRGATRWIRLSFTPA